MAEIKSLAELKKIVRGKIRFLKRKRGIDNREEKITVRKIRLYEAKQLEFVLGKINSLEASIKSECKKCPIFWHHKSHSVIIGYDDVFPSMLQKCKECKIYRIFGITENELRSILEGEGGERKG